MTFEEILPAIKKGKKAVRSGWDGSELFIELRKELYNHYGNPLPSTPYFLIKTSDEGYSMFSPTPCDVLAEDWLLVND
ncbi:DUF2829 domain-containing protein [Melissococcus plutonius]|uniref:Thoeris anti-defense 2-like domain-containing protein n=1 Tax=Melissococcus plutonius (strain ATCC 35311 / DSM 29964 / CIP 104052 / LMG 20360 / NCIMB 702443) TaxID=940190 RepID=F3YA44_MELPT|nr:DUF2829 domain-containing protein [Melissococcus plutonius]AIM24873.1 hypothetical protein MEPL_c008090 [Melissococcus plutonius S1]KMT25007.1 hypothetical protein MEPL2_2c05560 [Melissococcus plutonius]KMT26643.1 hypothetical protein MEPL3_2c03190 [Melissococcus plutonius]KMT27893.1 hypothetical protein MEPL1_3c05490 [Melissococcus plutonius]KMT29666.1 hypothetical protein MEPL4_3c05470 [Melissococcus plutonius]